ncbi:hypothetical protein PSECIP111951_01345 [Pseudoalteromonas holothuriae]|uniref:UPF0114 protein PSECIP111854_00075 n=1 Tax=Pseudoalteromonas holothuriae TaxID=2963714 RepID=A0A9W4QQU5_9GAMM|nr:MULTISPECIES: TIGR00645 family protein [unclassified Pseudoalteromonas]CAH9049442.1 hypothetical protein PSECIP111854_00075 [Pseudoalteromonas sp. CIP111854]CAH9055915.1 hypothetical protein PSECIP111951_01345 [Pseudoalteromonas sp. CIP111951]
MKEKIETHFEKLIFSGRWLLAPLFFGLFVAVLLLLVKFFKLLGVMVVNTLNATNGQMLINILTLVDTALLAGLLLIIIFSGYETFVSKLNVEQHEDRPLWMGKIGFSGLKIKLISAIVAISTIELFKVFLDWRNFTEEQLFWKVAIHMTFVASSILFSITDYINSKTQHH